VAATDSPTGLVWYVYNKRPHDWKQRHDHIEGG
jgi:hypothetical protein